MKSLRLLGMVITILLGILGSSQSAVPKDEGGAVALSGTVSSDAEGRMEGVVVSSKAEGSIVTVAVVSDHEGRYSFPASKLRPGKYALRIRAVGYDLLDDPGPVDVAADRGATVDLKLRKTKDLAAQLSNAEWLMSAPGTEEQKALLMNCVGCHRLEVPLRSNHTKEAFLKVIHRMHNYDAISGLNSDVRAPNTPGVDIPLRPEDERTAEYLSTINLRSSHDGKSWGYELKILPRPKGNATKVIYTQYDLPRPKSQPHDVVVNQQDGMVWYIDFGKPYIGKLDPRTGGTQEWEVPNIEPAWPRTGMTDVKFDRQGYLWLGIHQLGFAKFDTKTEKFQTWRVPPKYVNEKMRTGMVSISPDGSVSWIKDSGNSTVHKLDVRTGKISSFALPVRFYGMDTDIRGNLYMASLSDGVIGEMDQNGKLEVYPTPTPKSGSRRGHIDAQQRFWFGEYNAKSIAMFDINTKKIQEWPLPDPYAKPYDAVSDKTGKAWAGGMHTDRVYRLDPATGEVTPYLLPNPTNIRRVDVDNSTNPPTFWAGDNHGARIIKVEPFE